MFQAQVLIVRGTKIVLYSILYRHTYRWPSRAQSLHGTDTYRCDDSRGCIIQLAFLTMTTSARNM